jgi:uncharacterized membrane protein YagU involved in acid resistance
VLPSVASGPFGGWFAGSIAAQPVGLLVHFALMLAMVAAYVLVAWRRPILDRQWLVAGLLYGLALWLVMYWIVLPWRFSAPFPSDTAAIARQLISHCLLVGIPIAWITARASRPAA